jgi:hypothetical protein
MSDDIPNVGTEIGPNLWVRMVPIADLKEQDVNARVMAPREFERLVENIRSRGALESLPYCSRPNDDGPINIVSGHHRVRAARAAGLWEIPVMVDTADITRSQLVAKQLAHNFLAGQDDEDILVQLLAELATPDDMLSSGAPDEMLQNPDHEAMLLFAPHLDFEQRKVTFAFLPHQTEELEAMLDKIGEENHELVVLGYEEQFEYMLRAASKLARVRRVLSGATAITLMVRLATEEVEAAEEAQRQLEAESEIPAEEPNLPNTNHVQSGQLSPDETTPTKPNDDEIAEETTPPTNHPDEPEDA